MKILFETERLIIRQWEDSDYMDLYDYASKEEVTKFLSWPTYKSVETAKERIAFLKTQYAENVIETDYAIQEKESGRVVGAMGLVHYKAKNHGEIEIGYVLNPKFQGKGIMTECLVAMFKHIKRTGLAKRIFLRHDVLNEKSGNVMKRAGMTFEGILRKAGQNNFHDRCDLAVYSILDEEIEL